MPVNATLGQHQPQSNHHSARSHPIRDIDVSSAQPTDGADSPHRRTVHAADEIAHAGEGPESVLQKEAAQQGTVEDEAARGEPLLQQLFLAPAKAQPTNQFVARTIVVEIVKQGLFVQFNDLADRVRIRSSLKAMAKAFSFYL